jgi:hypothetical protein
MTDNRDPVVSAVTGTALSAVAGLVGGPVLAAFVGLLCGLPARLIALGGLAVVIWLDPMFGIWLAITAVAAIGGFILGVFRKPPPGLGCITITSREDGTARVAQLQDRLAESQARERALLAALTYPHHIPGSPRALPAPVIRGQVTR